MYTNMSWTIESWIEVCGQIWLWIEDCGQTYRGQRVGRPTEVEDESK